mgnify:CR=1 FL=1
MEELINKRKTVSDSINNTDKENFDNKKELTPRQKAAKDIDDRDYDLEIKSLKRRTDIDDLLEYDLEE